MDGLAAEQAELYRLAQERYPNLPLVEAYLQLHHDFFVKLPKEVVKLINDQYPGLITLKTLSTCADGASLLTGNPKFSILANWLLKYSAPKEASKLETILPELLPELKKSSIRSCETNETLGKIASELKRFDNYHLYGQITNAGALLTSTAAVYYIKKMAEHTGRIADNLERIGDHIRSSNLRGDNFPAHCHSYVRSMMEKHRDEPAPHYFFIFNQSTEWQPKFDDINRAEPLGPHYLGYSHDLDGLVDFLVGTARPRLGPEAIFHILIPTVTQLAITESLTFPDQMGPFRVSGQLGEGGIPYVYLCMPERKCQENLRQIGSLKPRPRWVLLQQAGLCLPIVGYWLSTTLEPVYFDDPPFAVVTEVGTPLYCSAYVPCGPLPPRTLGRRRAA
ncbi:hypothetical protein OQA88_939 [Cercophora sp. LCS_1]